MTRSFQGGRSVPTRCKSKKYQYYLNCTVCGNDDPFTWKKDSSISRQNATTCCFDDGSFFTIGGGSAQQWLFHLCRIFAFLDHVKEGVDIGRDYNVPKWADIMILACDSNRFNRVQQILPRWKGSKNPKITISCYRRVPGLGTALTKTAMKDVEEKGVKVGIIFNSFLKSLSLNILLYYVCTYAWDLFVFLVMCVVWCLDIDVNVYLLAKSLWCNNPR